MTVKNAVIKRYLLYPFHPDYWNLIHKIRKQDNKIFILFLHYFTSTPFYRTKLTYFTFQIWISFKKWLPINFFYKTNLISTFLSHYPNTWNILQFDFLKKYKRLRSCRTVDFINCWKLSPKLICFSVPDVNRYFSVIRCM